MTAGQKKRLLGGIRRPEAMWEKWYEAILEEEKLQDSVSISVRPQRRKCMQFYSTPLSTYEEELFDDTHVFWWQLLVAKKRTSACRYSMLPCSRSLEVHTYYFDCCPLRIIRRLSGFWTRLNEWSRNCDYQYRSGQCASS